MKPSSRPLAATALAFVLFAAFAGGSARAQTIYQQNFEGLTPGPGVLTNGGLFTGYVFGDAGPNTGDLAGDSLQGVTSAGGSRAGYLGGAGTNLSFSGSGYLLAGLFPGSSTQAVSNFRGTTQAVLTLGLDFSIQRSSPANQQTFGIYLYDAVDAADTNTFANHSYINIGTDNYVYLQDYYYNNVSSP